MLEADIPNGEKSCILQKICHLSCVKTNIMVAGATRTGKSSAINTLFHVDCNNVDYEENAAQTQEIISKLGE